MGRKYSRIDDPQLTDLAFLWDESASDWRLTAYTNIRDLMQANLTLPDAGKQEFFCKHCPSRIPGTRFSNPVECCGGQPNCSSIFSMMHLAHALETL